MNLALETRAHLPLERLGSDWWCRDFRFVHDAVSAGAFPSLCVCQDRPWEGQSDRGRDDAATVVGSVRSGGIPMFLVAFFATSTPDDNASAAKVLSYYRGHRGAANVGNLALVLMAVLVVFFAVRLREVLIGNDLGGGLWPTAPLCGAAILAAGLMLDAAVTFGGPRFRHGFAVPAQSLNVLQNNDFYPILGGIAILMLAAGIATVRRPVLPRWLGWTAIVLGVLALAGPLGVIGAALSLIWLLVVAILLSVRKDLIAAGDPEVITITP